MTRNLRTFGLNLKMNASLNFLSFQNMSVEYLVQLPSSCYMLIHTHTHAHIFTSVHIHLQLLTLRKEIQEQIKH